MKKWKLPKIKKRYLAGGVVLCVLAASTMAFLSGKSGARGEERAGYLEASVTQGTIETSVSGTGTISYADSTDIVLPSDLVVDELLVSEGSPVTAGTLLATVDEASLATCLSAVEEAISEADSTIADEDSSSSARSIKAGVAGRVKKIYAGEADSVAAVMKENGALMLLSVDDLMAVRLTAVGNVTVGDEVQVSNGDTQTEGTVETVEEDGVVVTFDDSVFDYEEEVTVTSEDGISLGKGNAYIHQQIQVVGSSGTISSLNVSENSTVTASTKVYTLDDSAKSPEYQQAVKEREQLVALLERLISIQTDGGIMAETDGVLETVNLSTEASASEQTTSSGGTMSEALSGSGNVVAEDGTVRIAETSQAQSGFFTLSAVQETVLSQPAATGKTSVEAPGNLAGGAGVITGTTTEMEYAHSEDADNWTACTEGTTTVAAGIWYVRYRETDAHSASAAVQITVTAESTEEGSTTGTQTTEDTTASGTEKTTEEGAESKGSGTNANSENPSGTTASGSESKKSTGSITISSGGSASSASSSASSSDTITTVETVSAFVIANGDKMKVTMNVDELDIGSMQEGLSAEITLDAIEGETFTGEITGVSGSASASNGVAQYPVEITFEKTDAMLSGMNASVAVIVEQAENVLTVPLAAVTDMGDKAYVYTGYDASSGELTGQTEVTLGLSDENDVEIQSGLSQGDTIYYQIMGSEENSSNDVGGMGGFDMNGMGGMPGGGDRQFEGGGRGNGGMPGGGSQ